MRDVRLAVVGDAFAAGVGDPKALGWVGRVVARSQSPDLALTVYNLGRARRLHGRRARALARGDRPAVRARRRPPPGRRIGARRRRARASRLARTRLNLANVLDDAAAYSMPPFVVGPPPSSTSRSTSGCEVVADAQADVCARRPCRSWTASSRCCTHEQWQSDLATGDGVHPGPGRLRADRLAGAAPRLAAVARPRPDPLSRPLPRLPRLTSARVRRHEPVLLVKGLTVATRDIS